MPRLIQRDGYLGKISGRLVTDAGGAQCCCNDCCVFVPPDSQCEYANQSLPNQPLWPINGEYQDCAECIRFRRIATGTMVLTMRYRHLLNETSDRTNWQRGSIAVGLSGRMTVCYTSGGASPVGTCYLEGALYDQLETSRGYRRDYVRAGTSDEGTREVAWCSTANLPLLSREPDGWAGDVALFQQPRTTPALTNNPIHAYWYRLDTSAPWFTSNPNWIRTYCQCDVSFESPGCPYPSTGTGLTRYRATVTDNGISGAFTYRFSKSSNCFYPGFGRNVVSELVEYDCTWIRIPCRCSGGTTEISPITLPPVPPAPQVTNTSALELL